jgi:hypothetical protein
MYSFGHRTLWLLFTRGIARCPSFVFWVPSGCPSQRNAGERKTKKGKEIEPQKCPVRPEFCPSLKFKIMI